MHKFTCTECPSTPFYTTFALVYDEPAFCPNCGQQTTVSYVGEVNQDVINVRFEDIMNHMRRLYDIRKSSMRYGLSDLADWMEHELDRVLEQLDELQADIEEVKV